MTYIHHLYEDEETTDTWYNYVQTECIIPKIDLAQCLSNHGIRFIDVDTIEFKSENHYLIYKIKYSI